MNRRILLALGVAFPLLALSGCRDSTSSLPFFSRLGPSHTEPPPPGPIPANAREVVLGLSTEGVVRGTDAPCPELEDPQDEFAGSPCQPFKVTAPSTGYVTVVVSSPDRTKTACVVFVATGSRRMRSCFTMAKRPAEMQLLGGLPYAFGVEFLTGAGDRLAPGDVAAFTLTAAFSPNSAYGSVAGAH